MKVGSIVENILKVLIAGVFSLFLLNLFVLFYDYSGIHITNSTGATDYTWLSNMWRSNCEEGFAFFHFDKYGFNNKKSEDSKPTILMIGSSHMEAVQVKQSETTSSILNNLLPDENTYNIGISGHTIYTCIKNLSSANSYYKPSKYIIIETDQVLLNDVEMGKVLNNTYPTIPSYSTGLFYRSQIYFPIIKTLYKKISDWGRGTAVNIQDTKKTLNEKELNIFLEKANEDTGKTKLIIFFHPETNLDSNGKLIMDANGVEEFKAACDNNDITFVDMTSDFQKLYSNEHKLPYGFINTGVGIGHLNKYGHEVIADRLAKTIEELESQN